jgi:hypothetical protein
MLCPYSLTNTRDETRRRRKNGKRKQERRKEETPGAVDFFVNDGSFLFY